MKRRTAINANPYGDEEQRAFIECCPLSMTYSELAGACLGRFGTPRAWPRQKIMDYWMAKHRARSGPRSFADNDPELAHFIEDRAARGTIDSIRGEAIIAFGKPRVPSRSAIHEFLQSLHSRARRRASQAMIARDAELRGLVESMRGRCRLEEAEAACLAAFGPTRAPSKAMIAAHYRSMPPRRVGPRRSSAARPDPRAKDAR
jgi:hypothetical protein